MMRDDCFIWTYKYASRELYVLIYDSRRLFLQLLKAFLASVFRTHCPLSVIEFFFYLISYFV